MAGVKCVILGITSTSEYWLYCYFQHSAMTWGYSGIYMGFTVCVRINPVWDTSQISHTYDLSVPSYHKQNCDTLTLFVKSNSKIKVAVVQYWPQFVISEFNQLKGLQNVLIITLISDFVISVMFSYLRNAKFEASL